MYNEKHSHGAPHAAHRESITEERLPWSVIVPARRADAAARIARALRRDCHDFAPGELLVVAPADEPGQMASDAADEIEGARLVTPPRLMPPGAMRNLGAAAARGDVLLFIDDDCIPDPDWPERMLEALERQPDAAALACACHALRRDGMFRCADWCLFAPCVSDRPREGAVGSGALAVRRDAFEAVHGFDPTLSASEDWEFCLRLKAAGMRCFFNPAVSVRHDHGRGTTGAILASARRSGFAAGLEPQRLHPQCLTRTARVALRLAHPGAYALFSPYYAAVVAAAQWIDAVRSDHANILFGPHILLTRFAYQLGVWQRLRRDAAVNRRAAGKF